MNLGYMCEIAHRHGSLAGIQLWYSGGNAPSLESREVGRSPSQWLSPIFATRSVYGYEMDELDISAVINMYVEAGKRAEQAGFDLLEVSAGDDTVPIQFLEPRFNRRTDQYGGSFANRSRFFIEVLHALKRELGEPLRHHDPLRDGHAAWSRGRGGARGRRAAARVVSQRRGGRRYRSRSATTRSGARMPASSRFRKSGWMTPFIKQGKAILGSGIPVVGNGRLTSPDDMVALIRAGVLDIIGAARPSIADPFLPTKISEGRLDDIRECIGCNICVSKFQQGGQIMCTQNATIGEEYRRGWHPEKFTRTPNPCSVLVVGGGPPGMECARVLGSAATRCTCARPRASSADTGNGVATLPRLNEWSRVITYRQTQLAQAQEECRGAPRRRPNERGRRCCNYGADRVVIATGSHWWRRRARRQLRPHSRSRRLAAALC